MFPGGVPMGAQDRLQPPSIPYRFFASALLFHAAAWVLLLIGADELPGFRGGMGAVPAALHLITLGVLAMTALGAAFQLLPVATRHPLGPVWACRLTWALFVPGVVLFAAGLITVKPMFLHGGATLTAVGLGLGVLLIGRNLVRVADLPGVTWHTWIAVASAAALLLLGLALAGDVGVGFLPDRGAVAAAHAILAAYGFMGNLAMGFSTILVPMFVLGPNVPSQTGQRTAVLSGLGLVLAVGGVLAGLGWLAALGGVAGLAAVGLHLHALSMVLKKRMRKRLEPFFRLIFPAWGMLVLSLVLGIALALGAPVAPLWGFALVFGWLLTFVTALLQRIMPFLASMHSSAGGKPARLSELTARRPLDIHAACHGAALVLVLAGIAFDVPLLVRGGAVSGLGGAIAFWVFAALLARRYQLHMTSHS